MLEILLNGFRGDDIKQNIIMPESILSPNSPAIAIRKDIDGELIASTQTGDMTVVFDSDGNLVWTIPHETSIALNGNYYYDVSILDDASEQTIQYGIITVLKDVTRRNSGEIPVLDKKEYIETILAKNGYMVDDFLNRYRILDERDLDPDGALTYSTLRSLLDTPDTYGVAGDMLVSDGAAGFDFVNKDDIGLNVDNDFTINGNWVFNNGLVVPNPENASEATTKLYVDTLFSQSTITHVFANETEVDTFILTDLNTIYAGNKIVITDSTNAFYGTYICANELTPVNYTSFSDALTNNDIVLLFDGVEEAPINGNDYIRKDGQWVQANYFNPNENINTGADWGFNVVNTNEVYTPVINSDTNSLGLYNNTGEGLNIEDSIVKPVGTVSLGDVLNKFNDVYSDRVVTDIFYSTGTEYTKVAVGTNAELPTLPESGMIRYNSDLNRYEGYNSNSTTWVRLDNTNTSSNEGIEDTPDDGQYYVRTNGSWYLFDSLLSTFGLAKQVDLDALEASFNSHLAANNPHSITPTIIGLGNVDNTADIDKPISAAQQSALNNKANLTDFDTLDSQVQTHVNGNNPHNITSTTIGLENVDNTADINKPLSNAATAALNDKADDSVVQDHINDGNNPHAVNKAQVGLSDVENYSAADMPLSNAAVYEFNRRTLDVPADDKLYGRKFEEWIEITPDGNAADPTYSPEVPSDTQTIEVGGIPAGKTAAEYDGKTFNEMWDNLIFPTIEAYVAVQPNTSLSGVSSGIVEVGSAFNYTLSASFNQGTINNGNNTYAAPVKGPLISYRFYGEGTANPTSQIGDTLNINGAYIAGNQNWNLECDFSTGTGSYYNNKGIEGDNLDSQRLSGTFNDNTPNVNGIYPFMVGSSVNDLSSGGTPLYDELNKDVSTKSNKNIAYNAFGEYLYFAFPATYGTLSKIVDPNGFNVTGNFNVYVNDIVSTGLSVNYTQSYRIYRTSALTAANGIFEFIF